MFVLQTSLFLVLVRPLSASVFTWTRDRAWENPLIWDKKSLPGAGDLVSITSGPISFSSDSVSFAVSQIDLAGKDAMLLLAPNSQMTFAGMYLNFVMFEFETLEFYCQIRKMEESRRHTLSKQRRKIGSTQRIGDLLCTKKLQQTLARYFSNCKYFMRRDANFCESRSHVHTTSFLSLQPALLKRLLFT